MKEIISHCLLVISKEENFLLMSTLARSGNNFHYSGACPPLAGPHKIHGYDTTIKEAFLKKFSLLRSRFLDVTQRRSSHDVATGFCSTGRPIHSPPGFAANRAKTYLKLYSTRLEYRQLHREWLTSSFTLLVKHANRR